MNSEDWRNVPCSAKPYKGQEPYIFISYAHKDASMVFPVIERLVADGYRVWYDEGIDPGSEWPEIIANRLNDCTACIAFISKNSLDSHNCRREINFALHKQKHFISVMLEEVTMSAGMEMQLSVNQSIFKYKIRTEQDFYEKLYEAEFLKATKCVTAGTTGTVQYEAPKPVEPKTEEPTSYVQQPVVPEVPQPAPKKKKKGLLISLIVAVILVAAGVVAAFVLSDNEDDKKTVRMSNDLYDYTIYLEGDVIQLPCSYESLRELGWKLDPKYTDATVNAKAFVDAKLSKGEHSIYVGLGNPSTRILPVQECEIIWIGWEPDCGDTEIMLAKGIQMTSSYDTILEAYGEPVIDMIDGLMYVDGTNSGYSFEFDDEQDVMTVFIIINCGGTHYDNLFDWSY